MKMKILILACLALLTFITGCNGHMAVGADGKFNEAAFEKSIVDHQSQIKAVTIVATRLALLSIPKGDRAVATREVHDISLAVSEAIQTSPSLAQAKALALNVIDKSNSQYAELTALLLDSAGGFVEAELTGFYAGADSNQREKAGIALIRSVSEGVLQATSQTFTLPHHHSPSTRPSVSSDVTVPTRSQPEAFSPFKNGWITILS